MKINKEHIKFLLKRNTLKQKDVANKLNVSQQDFNNWMFRGIFPHFNKLEELAEILVADVNTLYYKQEVSEPNVHYSMHREATKFEMIPFYEIDIHQELSPLWADESTIEPKDYIYLPGIKADFFISYYGKGMEPEISSGDYIGLRKLTDRSFYNYGSTHAVLTSDQLIVRSLRKSTLKNHLILMNTADENDPIDLPIKSIKALFAVVVVIRRNLV